MFQQNLDKKQTGKKQTGKKYKLTRHLQAPCGSLATPLYHLAGVAIVLMLVLTVLAGAFGYLSGTYSLSANALYLALALVISLLALFRESIQRTRPRKRRKEGRDG